MVDPCNNANIRKIFQSDDLRILSRSLKNTSPEQPVFRYDLMGEQYYNEAWADNYGFSNYNTGHTNRSSRSTKRLKKYSLEDFNMDRILYRFLENGEVDMLLGNSSDAGKEFRTVVTFDSQPHYIVTRNDDTETLAQLNNALEKNPRDQPEFRGRMLSGEFQGRRQNQYRF